MPIARQNLGMASQYLCKRLTTLITRATMQALWADREGGRATPRRLSPCIPQTPRPEAGPSRKGGEAQRVPYTAVAILGPQAGRRRPPRPCRGSAPRSALQRASSLLGQHDPKRRQPIGCRRPCGSARGEQRRAADHRRHNWRKSSRVPARRPLDANLKDL